jgi:four helix bundle protein
VGARRIEDLIVWQLGNELRKRVYALSATAPASGDLRFRDQLRDAAGSVTRNIAEGFGRFGHREFARFLMIARGSLFELTDHMHDGIARGYWNSRNVSEINDLCRRTIAAVNHLVHYLRAHPDP